MQTGRQASRRDVPRRYGVTLCVILRSRDTPLPWPPKRHGHANMDEIGRIHLDLASPGQTLDVVLSFEVIEYLTCWQGETYVRQMYECMGSTGLW